MQFNPGDGSGIVDEIDDICGSNSTTYPIESKTRRVNQALDEFTSIVLQYDKSWTYDDSNVYEIDDSTVRGLPIATRNLISGQQDYGFDDELLVLKGVFAKDTTGVFHELTEETEPQNSFLLPVQNYGVPTKYRLVGNSILLDYIPNYSSTGGLKVSYSRNGSKFKISDTDKEIGIPSIFHAWIAQVASLPYLIKNRLPNKNDIAQIIEEKKNPNNPNSIPAFFARRNATRKPRLVAGVENNK